MHMAVVVILLAFISRNLRRAILELFNVMRIAALEQPILPLSGSAGTALIQFRAPLAFESGHFGHTVATVLLAKTRRQCFQIDGRAVVYTVSLAKGDAMILIDSLPTYNCKTNR